MNINFSIFSFDDNKKIKVNASIQKQDKNILQNFIDKKSLKLLKLDYSLNYEDLTKKETENILQIDFTDGNLENLQQNSIKTAINLKDNQLIVFQQIQQSLQNHKCDEIKYQIHIYELSVDQEIIYQKVFQSINLLKNLLQESKLTFNEVYQYLSDEKLFQEEIVDKLVRIIVNQSKHEMQMDFLQDLSNLYSCKMDESPNLRNITEEDLLDQQQQINEQENQLQKNWNFFEKKQKLLEEIQDGLEEEKKGYLQAIRFLIEQQQQIILQEGRVIKNDWFICHYCLFNDFDSFCQPCNHICYICKNCSDKDQLLVFFCLICGAICQKVIQIKFK